MKITLVRHAQVLESYIGKYNGHIDIPLSEHGKVQAKELANIFKNEEFDKVYCSDLLRARETLDPFNITTEITFTPKLREKSWGKHEGKSFDEIEDSGIKYKNFEQWLKALDGEDIKIYQGNLKEYFYKTILESKYKNILIMTHAGFIKTLIGVVQKSPIEEVFALNLTYSSYVVFNKNDKIGRAHV